jgi:hypothetical protein
MKGARVIGSLLLAGAQLFPSSFRIGLLTVCASGRDRTTAPNSANPPIQAIPLAASMIHDLPTARKLASGCEDRKAPCDITIPSRI